MRTKPTIFETKLNRVLTEAELSDKALVQLINHPYSGMAPSLQRKFTDLLNSGSLPAHNRAYLQKAADNVRAAIALEDSIRIVTGTLVMADSYNVRGVIFIHGVDAKEIPRVLGELAGTTREPDSADWWKQDDVTTIDDMQSGDFSLLTKQGNTVDWSENARVQDIARVYGCYANDLDREYSKVQIKIVNGDVRLAMGEDDYEIGGLWRLMLHNIDVQRTSNLNNLKSDIEKYGLQIVNGAQQI